MDLVTIDPKLCSNDGLCVRVCPYLLFTPTSDGPPAFEQDRAAQCIRCGHCVAVCPHDAVHHREFPHAGSPRLDPKLEVPATAALQFLKGRRSIRAFRPEPVDKKLIATVIDAARWAPSASNGQPVHWLLVTDPAEVHRLAALVVEILRADPARSVFGKAWDRGIDMVLRGAPHLAIAHGPTGAWGQVDGAIALTYFDLAASAHGLGTCWAGILMRAAKSPEVAEALVLPADHQLFGALMFGRPALRYQRIPDRRPARIEWR